jgi:hypothetical protein
MKTKFYAQKDLVIDGVQVPRGTMLAESDHPLDRVVSGLSNGSVKTDPPKDEPAKAPAKK